MEDILINKVKNATKWSAITEVAAKCVTPITNIILARLLTPEAFGVVATAMMIFSFADMLTDAGFQNYLVQHEFSSEDERYKSTTVAFWTNLAISFLLWGVIAINADTLAAVVGNPGLGNVFIIACISLPLTSFSSIQIALFRRDFDFKTLFYVRTIGVLIPFIVTIPLAVFTHSYYALIFGTICGNLSNAIILTVKSKWKPNLFYSTFFLKNMFSFSFWSLVEAISIWLTTYAGVFIVGMYLNSYYLGIYKISINTVTQLTSLITNATTPVLFASLSRVQNDRNMFEDIFFSYQRKIALLLIPMSVGIYSYRSLITQIFLGSQWHDAVEFIGLWGLMEGVSVVISYYSSEVYRSLGKPKLSVLAQILHFAVLVPAAIIGAKRGFDTLYVWLCLVRLQFILVHLLLMYYVIHFPAHRLITNIISNIIASGLMALFALGLQQFSNNIIWGIFSIALCMVFYFSVLMFYPITRQELLGMVKPYRISKFQLNEKGAEE